MFVSGSQDSTLKVGSHSRLIPVGMKFDQSRITLIFGCVPEQVWDMKTKKLSVELPGHADQVFSVDWAPTSTSVASGGRDKILKLWRH